MKKLILILVLVFSISFISAAWNSTLNNGLVSYWTLDETSGDAQDSLGINDLTNNNSIQQNVNGIQGTAYNFTTDKFLFKENPTGILTENLSVCAWFNASTAEQGSIVGIGIRSGVNNERLVLRRVADRRIFVSTGGAANDLYTTNHYALNEWYFVCVTFNDTNMSIYTNGSIHGSKAVNNSITDDIITVGEMTLMSDQFNGTIDEVGVWNRTLQPSEVQQLYNDHNGVTFVPLSSSVTINWTLYNTTAYETSIESYVMNTTFNDPGGYTSLTAQLYLNGTAYDATKSGVSIWNQWNVTFEIPNITAEYNNSIEWVVNFTNSTGSYYFNSSIETQYVNFTQLVLCNATYTNRLLNFTFKDEDLNDMTGEITTSSFIYYLTNGNYTKSFTYVNTTENPNYEFCTVPNRPFKIDYTISYSNSTHPQRTYNPGLSTFANITNNITLYLLSEDDGQYVTFQVLNTAGQALDGTVVTANRTISGSTTEIGTGTTGDDGGVTFWLNPDFSHTFTFNNTAYPLYTTTLTPTQTTYTITLGETSSVSSDFLKGIRSYITPKANELFNDTSYSFTFNITSEYWTVTEFGFDLRLANGSVAGSDSSNTPGTAAKVTYNVNNQSIIYMDYYWIIGGNTTEGSRYWVISNTGNTQWSIKNFFTNLTTYMNSGIFGINDFTKLVIVFIFLFGMVGLMSYKYGLTNPMLVTGSIFAIVFFFDIVVDIIPAIRGIDNMLTYLAGILFIGTVLKEAAR